MRSRPILKKQAVKKRKRRAHSNLWTIIYLVGSYSVKLSCLLAGLVIVSLLFLSLYQYLLTSPYMRLERVILTGVDGELKRALIEMSPLNADTSLLALHLPELKQRMERHPWIRSVDLEKRFPHTLVIQAEKEKPCAIAVMENLHYMNRWGKIFEKVGETDEVDFPLVTGISTTGSEREMQLKLAAQLLRGLEAEKEPWSLEELSELHLEEKGRVSLYFRSLPAAVIELDGTQLDKKMDDLKRLVPHLKKTGQIHMVKRINLNYTDGAVVLFKKGKVSKVT